MIDELEKKIRILSEKVHNMVRAGTVSAVDEAAGTVRVAFADRDGTVSYNLPVLVPQTKANKDYWIPDVDEQVLCVFLPRGMEQGFVVGALYSEADKTPVADQDKRHLLFSDGTWLEYDRAAHKLTANVQGDVDLLATGKINVQADGDIIAESKTKTDVTAPQVNIHGNIFLDGPLTQGGGPEGDGSTLIGDVTVDGDVVISGISFLGHVHPENDGGNTGTPQ
jgi:phage baseplate assembly protein V